MGEPGQAAKQRKGGGGKSRTKSRRGGRAIAARAVRADAVAGVPGGQPVDEDAHGEGLGGGSVYSRLRLKATSALEKLVESPGVPPNVRAAAVRTALELVGAIGPRAKDQRDQEDRLDELDPERLSVEDIDREIAKLGRV